MKLNGVPQQVKIQGITQSGVFIYIHMWVHTTRKYRVLHIRTTDPPYRSNKRSELPDLRKKQNLRKTKSHSLTKPTGLLPSSTDWTNRGREEKENIKKRDVIKV